jgi:hypothetical protein
MLEPRDPVAYEGVEMRMRVVGVVVCSVVALTIGSVSAMPMKPSSKLIDTCALVTPAEAGAALGGTYAEGSTPKAQVKGWRPDDVTKGYGVCDLPYSGQEGALLEVAVWKYKTAAAAGRILEQGRKRLDKDGLETVEVESVGDVAYVLPAQSDPTTGGGVRSPMLSMLVGRYVVELHDARGDHTSPDGRKVADQTGESERLATVATTVLGRLPQ